MKDDFPTDQQLEEMLGSDEPFFLAGELENGITTQNMIEDIERDREDT